MTNLKQKILRRSPEILTGMGIAGMFTTVILAVKSTPKAVQIIEENELEDKKEIIKATWKCYIPPAISFIASSACLIGGSTIGSKRNTTLLAAYKLSENALREYKDTLIETMGSDKAAEIKDKVNEKKLKKDKNTEIIISGTGEVLCFDTLSNRYFKSSLEDVKRAENILNKKLIDSMYVSLSDLYDELYLSHTVISDYLGWNLDDGLIELYLGSHISDDGQPCIVIDFENPPIYDYDKFAK